MTGVGSNRSGRTWQGAESRCSKQQAATTVCGGSGMATGGGQTASPRRRIQTEAHRHRWDRNCPKKAFWISLEKRRTLLFLSAGNTAPWHFRSQISPCSIEAYEARANAHLRCPSYASRRTGLHILNPESAGPSECPRYTSKRVMFCL
jgi:hypothetical protein